MSLELTTFRKTHTLNFIQNWVLSNWMHCLLCLLLTYLLIQKDVTLSISFNKDFTSIPATKKKGHTQVPLPIAQTVATTIVQEGQLSYIQRFAKVAKSEMDKYGIPASVKLAQGLLESNAGKSRLATSNNNHFGIKCFSKKCKKGHCSNFSDDTHKDFFKVYNTAWESYRAHSELLQNKRYRHLLHEDYTTWAHGLVKAGYATDPQYGKKLIHLIETLELYKYDS